MLLPHSRTPSMHRDSTQGTDRTSPFRRFEIGGLPGEIPNVLSIVYESPGLEDGLLDNLSY